jgi:hypothetical protein
MMEIIARLITIALDACFQHGVIDWLPSEPETMPESFEAECEIELWTYGDSSTGDYWVTLAGIQCVIDVEDVTYDYGSWWHANTVKSEVQHA